MSDYTIDEAQDEIMEPKLKNTSVAVKFGLIAGMIVIILGLTGHFLDIREQWYNWLSTAILMGIAVYAIYYYRQNNGTGQLKFGEGLGTGTLVGLIAGIMGAIYLYLSLKFLFPEMLDEMEREAYRSLAEQGKSEQDIEKAKSVMRIFMNPLVLSLMSIMMSVFMCFLASLIGSLILQRK